MTRHSKQAQIRLSLGSPRMHTDYTRRSQKTKPKNDCCALRVPLECLDSSSGLPRPKLSAAEATPSKASLGPNYVGLHFQARPSHSSPHPNQHTPQEWHHTNESFQSALRNPPLHQSCSCCCQVEMSASVDVVTTEVTLYLKEA